MVSTRQMSTITAIGLTEIGTGNVAVTNASSSRNSSNSLAQQNGSTALHSSSSRQQASTSTAMTTTRKAGLSLLDMPFEIVEKIVSYTGYKEVSNMRLVSRQMNQTCITILNSTYAKLQAQLMKRLVNIKKVMPRRESARRSHPLYVECDIVETCYMRLHLLQMTFGRHIEHKHICFFPGSILDEVYNVLNYIGTIPSLGHRYKLTEELIDLSTMAMEYFKDHLEPTLPPVGLSSKDFFTGNGSSTTSTKTFFESNTTSSSSSTKSGQSNSMPSPPQSNMVLRKGIRIIKQGMKKYNNQLTVLRNDLRFCKRKSTDQTKQITELQNMLAEQQKQTLEYAHRLDEHDKKSDEMARKISTLLQELNKCKIELHYWRSKSPATLICNNCGQTAVPVPSADDLLALVNQSVNSSNLANVSGNSELDIESEVQSHDSSLFDLTQTSTQLIYKLGAIVNSMPASATTISTNQLLPAPPLFSSSDDTMAICDGVGNTNEHKVDTIDTKETQVAKGMATSAPLTTIATTLTDAIDDEQVKPTKSSVSNSNGVILTVGTPRFYGKRKADDTIASAVSTNANDTNAIGKNGNGNGNQSINALSSMATVKTATNIANSNISDNSSKKARRVQNKFKMQTSNVNIKTRNK